MDGMGPIMLKATFPTFSWFTVEMVDHLSPRSIAEINYKKKSLWPIMERLQEETG